MKKGMYWYFSIGEYSRELPVEVWWEDLRVIKICLHCRFNVRY